MASLNSLMAVGFSALQAQMLATGPINSITPAGASQGTATAVNAPSVILATAGAAGILMPPSNGQTEVWIYNNSGNAQNIYPAVGETINALTANTAISLATGKAANLRPGDKGWLYSLSA